MEKKTPIPNVSVVSDTYSTRPKKIHIFWGCKMKFHAIFVVTAYHMGGGGGIGFFFLVANPKKGRIASIFCDTKLICEQIFASIQITATIFLRVTK